MISRFQAGVISPAPGRGDSQGSALSAGKAGPLLDRLGPFSCFSVCFRVIGTLGLGRLASWTFFGKGRVLPLRSSFLQARFHSPRLSILVFFFCFFSLSLSLYLPGPASVILKKISPIFAANSATLHRRAEWLQANPLVPRVKET